MSVDSMLLATPSPLSLGGRLRAVGLGCDGETEVVVDVTDGSLAMPDDIEVLLLRAVVFASFIGWYRDSRGNIYPEPRSTPMPLNRAERDALERALDAVDS